MRIGPLLNVRMRAIIVVGIITLWNCNAAERPRLVPDSTCPELDQAVIKLAEGQVEQARLGFERLAQDPAQTPFARTLARLSLARIYLAEKDTRRAIRAWQQLADDPSITRAFRDLAKQQIRMAQRSQQGLPAYDPNAHRATLPSIPQAAVSFYVAPDGDDSQGGSKAHPLQSLIGARNAIRAWRRTHPEHQQASIQVFIQGGAYPVTQSLSLSKEDSGSPGAPVVYRAGTGQGPHFQGGIRISSWQPIADRRRKTRLVPAVREQVVQADLKTLGVTDLGDATALRKRPELFCNGRPQTLARWPNRGFVHTGDILGTDTFTVWNRIPGCRDGKFQFIEDRPSTWVDEADVHLYGYWFWDWFEEYQRVASIDAQRRTFTLSAPYSRYGYRKDQRYYAVNVFRELDQAGEWYLDRQNGMLYWLPPEGLDTSKATTVLSVYSKPFVVMAGVEHVILKGLTFEESRGDGIHIQGGAHTLVAGCTFRRLGGDAIVTRGGQRHGVFGCTMHTLGCAGMAITGGSREKLTHGRHFVENCTVHDISRLKRTYTPAVRLDGCGNRIAHSLFERMTSSALRIEGNEHLIELNVIRDVVKESDDQGGLDMFGNPLYRGVVIRWNRWSDIGGGTDCGAAGVRLDDMISGVLVHGNVFERCGAVKFGGVQIHGGKENLIDNNVFVDCFAGISFSRWSEERWLESIERFLEPAASPPYVARYPELTQLRHGANINLICRNLYAQTMPVLLREGKMQRSALNLTSGRRPDLDSPAAQIRFPLILMEPIPAMDMGPYDHPWRADPDLLERSEI